MAFVDPFVLAAAVVLLDVDEYSQSDVELAPVRQPRSCWSRQWIQRRCEDRGVLAMVDNELRLHDPDSYKNYYRLDNSVFEELLQLITPDVQKQSTVMREAISARQRLGVTLRFLASGCSFKDLSYSTRMAPNTISVIIPETLNAIIKHLGDKYIKTPTTIEEWLVVADKFHTQWNYPHCLGALDGKHISFRPPVSERAFFRNYKQGESIVLLGLVDAEYKFLYINVGTNGRMNDAGVFRASGLADALQEGRLNLPPAAPLPGRNRPVPYVIVADDAFPLATYLMKPYGSREADKTRKIHDYRLSRARRVVENAFGILSNRFRILLNKINLSAEKTELIVLASCSLHNFILSRNPVNPREEVEGNPSTDSQEWAGLQCQQRGNRHGNMPLQIRNEFKEYFCSVGSVPWQDTAVENYRW